MMRLAQGETLYTIIPAFPVSLAPFVPKWYFSKINYKVSVT